MSREVCEHNKLVKGRCLECLAETVREAHSPVPSALIGLLGSDVLQDRINIAVQFAIEYGSIDGDHHKLWVIDQMVRALAGDGYDTLVAGVCDGEDGPNTYSWDCGIAP